MTPASGEAFKRTTLRGLYWTAIEASLRTAFQFVITVALARLLTPEEFGIVAIVYLFVQFGWVLVEAGFASALVQQRDADDLEMSAIFHFQWMFALVIALILNITSPWIADFYGFPILDPLIRVLALNIFLNALGGVHRSLLERALAFRQLMIAGLVSTVIAGVLAVYLALNGAGVWALAIQALVSSAIFVALLWVFDPWRPSLAFRASLLKRSFSFGQYLLLSSVLEAIYGRLYGLVIGKMYGAADLGQYNRAASTQSMPVNLLTGIVSRVAFPAFSAIKDDKPRITAGLRKAMVGVMAITIPVMLGLLAVAGPLVITLFGEVWRPSIPLLRILCLAGLLWPMHMINMNVLLAQGQSRLFFQLEVAKKTVGVVLFVAAVPFGLQALAWSQVLYAVACFLIHARYTGRMLGYGALAQVRDCLPWFVAGAVMGILVWLLHVVLEWPLYIELPIQVAFGAAFYLTFWILWDASLLRQMAAALFSPSKLAAP